MRNLRNKDLTSKRLFWKTIDPHVTRWQHHAAAIGVFLVWGELMLMVGRLPTFGMASI